MPEFQLGSISTGTLRPEDLLPTFIESLTAIGGKIPDDIACGTHLEYTNLPSYSSVGVIDADDAFWQSDDARDDVDALIGALEECCPPFVYFGSLPGDGADFGFWPDIDGLRENLAVYQAWCGLNNVEYNHDGEFELEEVGVIVQVNDHGNVTVMDMDRNVLWSVV
jgi:hypothetical protein